MASSLSAGIMLVWFRWHYDKKLLRNIDDDEFMEFNAKCPERQAVMVSAKAVITLLSMFDS